MDLCWKIGLDLDKSGQEDSKFMPQLKACDLGGSYVSREQAWYGNFWNSSISQISLVPNFFFVVFNEVLWKFQVSPTKQSSFEVLLGQMVKGLAVVPI